MKMNNTHNHHPERGSILVFILIGIALFAALSFTVTQSLRVSTDSSGAATGTMERNTTIVTDLMQFLEVLKMRIFEMSSKGVAEGKFDFQNDVYLLPNGNEVTANNNVSCGGLPACSVFSPYAAGGGILPMTFPNAADTAQQTSGTVPRNGHGRVGEIDIKGVGTSAPDLVFLIYGIRPAICNLYNSKIGITTNFDDTTDMSSLGETGTSVPAPFSGYTTTNSFSYGTPLFEGKKSFCAPALSAGSHKLAIWQVLKIR